MKHLLFFTLIFSGFFSWSQHLLVFSKTEGYRHESIGSGQQAITKLALENNMTVTLTEDASLFESNILARIDVLIFLNTSGDILNTKQEKAVEAYIKNGGGFVGIHCATCTEYNWTWYEKMIGTYFDNHPEVQEAKLITADATHQSISDLPATWTKTDEWYNFKNELPEEFKVLLTIDESSYKGGTMGARHPISWCHDREGGRVFYTALGHTNETYSNNYFLIHLLEGIKWAAGK